MSPSIAAGTIAVLLAAALCAALPAHAAMSAEELAKISQNPVGNLVSVPFQSNTNLNYGPYKGTQNILNIQPVIPVGSSPDWNIITRTIVPVAWQPALSPTVGSANGIGDMQFSAFLSPTNPGKWIWGVGVIAQLPTNTSNALGNERWGLGPTAVVLHLVKDSPWVTELARHMATWDGRQAVFNYFSLVTITTMGYGDVTPVHAPATVLATLEAVFGQSYIAVVVAQLVGIRMAQASGPGKPA